MLELFSGRETIPAWCRMTNDNLNIEQAELFHTVAWQSGLAWEDVPNKITAGDRHDCQIFHVDQSRQRGALVTLLLGEDAWDATGTVPMSYCPTSLTPEWTRQMSAAVRQAHYWDNRGSRGDSGQAANAPNSPIETLIYGLFQFQIVAWVVIGHIHSMEQISSYGLDPPIPPFSLIFIAADIVRGREDKLPPVPEKGAQFG